MRYRFLIAEKGLQIPFQNTVDYKSTVTTDFRYGLHGFLFFLTEEQKVLYSYVSYVLMSKNNPRHLRLILSSFFLSISLIFTIFTENYDDGIIHCSSLHQERTGTVICTLCLSPCRLQETTDVD